MILIIKIEAKDKLEAYKIVGHLGFGHEVLEAEFDGEKYVFDNGKEETSVKKFLSEKFNKNNITKIK